MLQIDGVLNFLSQAVGPKLLCTVLLLFVVGVFRVMVLCSWVAVTILAAWFGSAFDIF